MAWETVENPARSMHFQPLPADGVRVALHSNGSDGRKRINIAIGADLARKIGLTEAAHKCRVMVGRGGPEEGRLAVVNDGAGEFWARRRPKNGCYDLTIGHPAARENFNLDFERFERTRLEAIRPTNGQSPYFAFYALEMLPGAGQ